MKQSDQNNEFIFGEKNNYHQIDNGYLEFHITVGKNDFTIFHNEDPIRLVNIAFAFCFREARLSKPFGSEIEHKKFCGQVSTVMIAISNKDGDLLSQFDNINVNGVPILSRITDLTPQFISTTHQKKLIDNHIDALTKVKLKDFFI